ncbi:hypothetical protein D1872_261750 [compost metagenome]
MNRQEQRALFGRKRNVLLPQHKILAIAGRKRLDRGIGHFLTGFGGGFSAGGQRRAHRIDQHRVVLVFAGEIQLDPRPHLRHRMQQMAERRRIREPDGFRFTLLRIDIQMYFGHIGSNTDNLAF